MCVCVCLETGERALEKERVKPMLALRLQDECPQPPLATLELSLLIIVVVVIHNDKLAAHANANLRRLGPAR